MFHSHLNFMVCSDTIPERQRLPEQTIFISENLEVSDWFL